MPDLRDMLEQKFKEVGGFGSGRKAADIALEVVKEWETIMIDEQRCKCGHPHNKGSRCSRCWCDK